MLGLPSTFRFWSISHDLVDCLHILHTTPRASSCALNVFFTPMERRRDDVVLCRARIGHAYFTVSAVWKKRKMFLPHPHVKVSIVGSLPWPRGSMLGLRLPGLEFRILCLEDSVISIISPSSGGYPGPVQPICAQRWPKARLSSFFSGVRNMRKSERNIFHWIPYLNYLGTPLLVLLFSSFISQSFYYHLFF